MKKARNNNAMLKPKHEDMNRPLILCTDSTEILWTPHSEATQETL